MNFGSKYLQDKCVKDCLQGKKFICLAITEPYAGSDVAGLRTTAKKDPTGKFYIVNGEKKWITNGVFCDFFTVAVRTGGEGAGGLSLLLLERGMPGLATKQMKVRALQASCTRASCLRSRSRRSAWACGRLAPRTSPWRTSRCRWRTSSASRTTASSTVRAPRYGYRVACCAYSHAALSILRPAVMCVCMCTCRRVKPWC
jgi:hypothetical protein